MNYIANNIGVIFETHPKFTRVNVESTQKEIKKIYDKSTSSNSENSIQANEKDCECDANMFISNY